MTDVTATLAFRVGTADETYATTGITRLVRELARPDGCVTATDATRTAFTVTGAPEEVAASLRELAARLRDLPVDRLDALRAGAESASPGVPVAGVPVAGGPVAGGPVSGVAGERPTTLAARRFGPRGYGLAGYPELAPGLLSAEAVRDWARARFTRDNAGLRVTGGTPPDLDTLGLPRGTPVPPPAVVPVLPATPVWFRGADGDAPALDGVVPRSDAARRFAEALHGAGARYEPLGEDHATITLTGPDPDALVAATAPERTAGAPDDVRAAAQAFRAAALLRLPPGAAPPPGFTEAPRHSPDDSAPSGPGTTRHRFHPDIDRRLLLSADAVSVSSPDGFTTVRYDACAAMLSYPDGGRLLVGLDGFAVAVEPTLYATLTPDRVAVLDAAVDPAVVVRMPERARDAVPRPPAPEDSPLAANRPAAARPGPAQRRPAPPRRTVALYGAVVAAALVGLVAIRVTYQELSAPHPRPTVVAMFWIVFAGLLVVVRDLRGQPKDRTHIRKWWTR